MEIRNITDDLGSRFEVVENGEVLGELVYDIPFPDRLIIKHTAVSISAKGKGYGKDLIKAAVELANQKSLEVVPVCAFAVKMKMEHPELYEA